MSGPTIHFPTGQEEAAEVKAALARMSSQRAQHRLAAVNGIEALKRLVLVLAENHHTGQPYKLRSLIYSLWNGKPADLSDLLCLDWNLKQDFLRVAGGFGYEDRDVKFFYAAVEQEFRVAGLFDWFVEEHNGKVRA